SLLCGARKTLGCTLPERVVDITHGRPYPGTGASFGRPAPWARALNGLGGSIVFGISRRRSALAAALSAAAISCCSTAAQAHPGQVVHLRVRGEMAQAIFQRGATATVVDAESDNQFGPALVYDRFTESAEGGVDVSGAVFGDDVSVA